MVSFSLVDFQQEGIHRCVSPWVQIKMRGNRLTTEPYSKERKFDAFNIECLEPLDHASGLSSLMYLANFFWFFFCVRVNHAVRRSEATTYPVVLQ